MKPLDPIGLSILFRPYFISPSAKADPGQFQQAGKPIEKESSWAASPNSNSNTIRNRREISIQGLCKIQFCRVWKDSTPEKKLNMQGDITIHLKNVAFQW